MRQSHYSLRISRRQKEIMRTQSVPIFFPFGVIHGQQTLLPIQIQYYDKNTICKITVEITNLHQ